MSGDSEKGVVTCDLEGRIESFEAGAERIFGWRAADVVGKKRLSALSPGIVALAELPGWLASANAKGEHTAKTVLVRRGGEQFAAKLRIARRVHEGSHTGYAAVAVPLPGEDPAALLPAPTAKTRLLSWLVITRLPFLTATIVPVMTGAAVAIGSGRLTGFPWAVFLLTLVGACALHVAANVWNDYFDWRSGTDQANTEYLQPFSGGSRAIELGLATEDGLFRLASASLAVAAGCGLALMVGYGRWGLLLFGAVGAFGVYFYTAPPIRLAARRGLGELTVGLGFGPLMVAGAAYALTGTAEVVDFLAGLPAGLLTAAILWVNEIPDSPSDLATGKETLVAVLGKEKARWGWVALVGGAFAVAVAGTFVGVFPAGALLTVAAAPIAVKVGRVLFREYAGRGLVAASAGTIRLHLIAGLFFAGGLLAGPFR